MSNEQVDPAMFLRLCESVQKIAQTQSMQQTSQAQMLDTQGSLVKILGELRKRILVLEGKR